MNETWPLIITVHAVSASLALTLGAYQLIKRPKGGKAHKFIGRFWVLFMYGTAISSFGIQTLNDRFSWLHVLSILTLVTVTVGIMSAVKGKIKAHKSFMQGSYYGLLGAFIGVITVPTRRIPQMAILDLPSFFIWTSILLAVSLSVIGVSQLIRNPTKKRE